MAVPQVASTAKRVVLAPGARVVIRDEEWIVHSVKPASWGGDAVHVTGTSELVRNKSAIFLTELDEVRELRPEETELVHDPSPRYRRSRLYLEALLRRSPPTDSAIYVGHRGAIREVDYQLQPAAKALRQPRPRILMADGVGLGKTIEVGILLSELIRRGRGERILVVALKAILAQFQQELWARFTIPLVRLDSVGIQRLQSKIPSNQNPFYFFNRAIISIDTLKKDEKYRRYLEECRWDAIVVDECQNVAVRTTGRESQKSQRARLAELLARTTDALIFTSATPHDGRPESFASLINLLEPTAIADPEEYTSDEVSGYFLRRFKKDIQHEVEDEFCERNLEIVKLSASEAENAVFDRLRDVEFRTIGRERGGHGILFRTLLLKSFLSSPAACASTITKRLGHKALEKNDDEARHDRSELESLLGLVNAVTVEDFTKLGTLLEILRGLGLDAKKSEERVVVFSERIDTLTFLQEQIRKKLKLKADAAPIFHGTLEDRKQAELVKSFGTADSPIRVLLASDAAAEGINLHFFCHRMIHFDLPWSLITLEQRNGRIDRFGQEHTPEIRYLLTLPDGEESRGDLRVLERLIEKEDAAHKNLGDVAWLMGLHEAEKEEEHVGKGIEQGADPEQIIGEDAQHTDLMDLLFGEGTSPEPPPEIGDPPRLFADDLAYSREALSTVLEPVDEHVDWLDEASGFRLHPPDDLRRRYEYLPRELRRRSDEVLLTTDRGRVMRALEESRKDEETWPEWELFWELHPVATWLDDRVLAEFGRHEAPVLRVGSGVAGEEAVFVFQGLVSNHRSQPVVVDWFGVRCAGGAAGRIESLRSLSVETGLDREHPNPGKELPDELSERLMALRGPAVDRAREHMKQLRKQRAADLGDELRDGLRKLTQWHDVAHAALHEEEARHLEKRSKLTNRQQISLDRRRERLERIESERKRWINDGMRTVEEPYLRLAAVLVAGDSV